MTVRLRKNIRNCRRSLGKVEHTLHFLIGSVNSREPRSEVRRRHLMHGLARDGSQKPATSMLKVEQP